MVKKQLSTISKAKVLIACNDMVSTFHLGELFIVFIVLYLWFVKYTKLMDKIVCVSERKCMFNMMLLGAGLHKTL